MLYREFFLAARSGTISKLARAENILLHESEVILMNEKVCTAIDESSHKRRMQLLPWKENPVSLMHDSFFMLALSTSGIEIQLLNAKAGAELIQSIRLEGFNQLCMKQNGDLYAASPIQGRVVSIERRPGHQIVEQLLKCFAFENALDAIRFFPLDQVRLQEQIDTYSLTSRFAINKLCKLIADCQQSIRTSGPLRLRETVA